MKNLMELELLIARIKNYRELRKDLGGYPEVAEALDLMTETARTRVREILAEAKAS